MASNRALEAMDQEDVIAYIKRGDADAPPRPAHTMTKTEAQTLREAAHAAVRRYSKMTKAQLRAENRAAQEATGMYHVYGGPVSKDELIADTLELRGYGLAKLNEATHVVAHDVVWPDCQWCQAGAR